VRIIEKKINFKLDASLFFQEKLWQEADSLFLTRQFSPYYDSQATYKTKVKVLQDENNLYFLLSTDFGPDKPRTALSGENESYSIYLDPLLSRVSAYYFTISSSGSRWDGMVLSDGAVYDNSWDGVWESSVKVFRNEKGNWQLLALIKIPFKILRFRKDNPLWGLQISSYYQKTKERCYWLMPDKEEGLRVSRFGILKGIKPKGEGKGLELYPVALMKNTWSQRTGNFLPGMGIDFAYKKEASTLNLTLFPDFAEIEADPFTMSLGKYEIYYPERRPFFLEGKEIFEPAQTSGGFYSPVEVFYSRRIGRVMRDGSGEVPILAGAKYTGKISRYEIGLMSCLTGDKFGTRDTAWSTSWNVLRVKRYFLKNSEIGVLSTYKRPVKENDWHLSLDFDALHRWGKNQIGNQLVFNYDTTRNLGFLAQVGGLFYFTKNLFSGLSGRYVGEDFDVSDMGYAQALPGNKLVGIFAGFTKSPPKGAFSSYTLTTGYTQEREKGEPDWSRFSLLETNFNLRKPVIAGSYLSFGFGKDYEGEIGYHAKSFNQNIWLEIKKLEIWFGHSHSFTWNYRRNFLAWRRIIWSGFNLPITHRISLNPDFNSWIEYDTTGKHLSTTISGNIYLSYSFSPFMKITISPNPVFLWETSSSLLNNKRFEIPQMRIALLYSWEIKPRSKFYLVWNQLLSQEERWETQERIVAIKLRWLFLF